jgi:hypothetical protein
MTTPYVTPGLHTSGPPPSAAVFGPGSYLPDLVDVDVEAMAQNYLSNIPLPYAVGTRLPGPDDDPSEYQLITVNGFVRVEEINVSPCNELEFDIDWALHGYHPDEAAASYLTKDATSRAANAQGNWVTVPELELPWGGVREARAWYIGWSRAPIRSQRQEDPTVEFPAYRSLITWRVAGKVIP